MLPYRLILPVGRDEGRQVCRVAHVAVLVHLKPKVVGRGESFTAPRTLSVEIERSVVTAHWGTQLVF